MIPKRTSIGVCKAPASRTSSHAFTSRRPCSISETVWNAENPARLARVCCDKRNASRARRTFAPSSGDHDPAGVGASRSARAPR